MHMQSHRTPSHIYTVNTQNDIYGTHATKVTQSHAMLPQATPQNQYIPLHFHTSEKDVLRSVTDPSSSEKGGDYNIRTNQRRHHYQSN